MIAALFAEYAGPIVGIVLAFFGVIGAYFGGKKAGTATAETKAAEVKATEAIAVVTKVTETAKETNNVQTEINAMPDSVAVDKLRDGWTRDDWTKPAGS